MEMEYNAPVGRQASSFLGAPGDDRVVPRAGRATCAQVIGQRIGALDREAVLLQVDSRMKARKRFSPIYAAGPGANIAPDRLTGGQARQIGRCGNVRTEQAGLENDPGILLLPSNALTGLFGHCAETDEVFS